MWLVVGSPLAIAAIRPLTDIAGRLEPLEPVMFVVVGLGAARGREPRGMASRERALAT